MLDSIHLGEGSVWFEIQAYQRPENPLLADHVCFSAKSKHRRSVMGTSVTDPLWKFEALTLAMEGEMRYKQF
jgi:hypothetical protein